MYELWEDTADKTYCIVRVEDRACFWMGFAGDNISGITESNLDSGNSHPIKYSFAKLEGTYDTFQETKNLLQTQRLLE